MSDSLSLLSENRLSRLSSKTRHEGQVSVLESGSLTVSPVLCLTLYSVDLRFGRMITPMTIQREREEEKRRKEKRRGNR